MALYIKAGVFESDNPSKEWHVGEPIPEINSRVVSFQADGDELYLILEAMKGIFDFLDFLSSLEKKVREE